MRLFIVTLIFANFLRAAEPTPAQLEHFEKKVRPLLADHCYSCHSSQSKKEPKGGLRVDGREHLMKGGDNGAAIVAGEPGKSLLIKAVKYADSDLQMPPKAKLTDAQIKDLEQWIADGAVWPGPAAAATVKEEFNLQKRKAEHWAWQPVAKPTPPAVKNTAWTRDAVDNFILHKLEAAGINPTADADSATWLRRVTFALTGLPPTPDEITAFIADANKEKVVDRLLASPAYGERWGRHWLDLMRYAESRGHEFDVDIANAWQYRDYIIRALNADVPYDRLVREHLAGDAVANARRVGTANEAVIGTAFWRLGEEVQSPVDIRQDQADRFDNRIDVMSKAFLAMTVSCARCHDHKFDAISTKDYYALFGMLQGSADTPVRIDGEIENETIKPRGQPQAQFINLGAGNLEYHFGDGLSRIPYTFRHNHFIVALDPYWNKLARTNGSASETGKLGKHDRSMFTLRSRMMTAQRKFIWHLVRGGGQAYTSFGNHTLVNGPLHQGIVEHFKDNADFRWVKQSLAGYAGQRFFVELTADPKTRFAAARSVQSDTEPELPKLETEVLLTALTESHAEPVWKSRIVPGIVEVDNVTERIFIRGNRKTLGDAAPAKGLEALEGTDPKRGFFSSGRSVWANRMTDPAQNPLLARVAVNRLWHHLFGRGIVASTDNFGVLGDRPTHPELLDYLASEFTKDGMSMKRLIKRLVLTRSYAMASTPADEKDPANLLLHTFRIKRLEGEAIRDAMLAVSGTLDRTAGGPPIPIHLTPFMEGRGRPAVSGPVHGEHRRSIYLSVRRNFLSPLLLAFDTPIPFSTVGRRQVSNVPAQALILMNDPFVHGEAAAWGERLAKAKGTREERITEMWMRAFGRAAMPAEVESCLEMVQKDDAKTWATLAHALFNVKEFIFVR